MYHLRKIKVLLATCLLACTSLWAQDTKLSLDGASAWASSDQGGNEGAASVIDGDYGKFWHSQWYWGAVFETKSSVDLTIALSEITLVDYVRYIPRQNNNQGHWGEVELFYSPNTSGDEFISVGTFNLNKADIPHDFFLNGMEGIECGQIKFTIRSGSNNHATAAEIEMYQLDKAKLNAFAQYFDDEVYSQLKSNVTSSDGIADADVKALVEAMLADAADYKKFRVGEYEAYETIGTLQQRLKTKNPYNKFENPTGIYLNAGEPCIVAVSGIGDYPVGLKIKNWYTNENSSSYILRNGLNYITATSEGNVFVNYYTDNYATAPNVKVHFINAPVLGYWDAETMNNADWVKLLQGKADDDHRIIITRSKHAQLAYPISAWKTHCPTDIKTTMTYYQQVQWALRDMMGLERHGLQTKNRQLYYATNYGFMAAGEEGAYCDYESLGAIMKPDNKSFDFWGVGHEWGHNNQIYPGFHWSGCGETTNNIYASWAQYHFTGNRDANGHPTYLRLEDEKTGIDEYSDMRGGRMQTYFEEALRKGVAWQLQDGPDYHNATPNTITVTGRDADGNDLGEVTTTSRNYDHFVKLAPFWQLNLWGTLANKCPYIIPEVIHAIRTTENYGTTYNTNGKQQINWMKLACDAAEIDLLPFFEKAGMLRPIHAYIEDYGAGWNIINEEMINELKQYVKTKGYPAFTEEINYINAHNMHIYRDNLKLNVTKMQGELNGDKLTIQHIVDGQAQNAVAFETYNAQDELIRITMYGLGSDDTHSYTQVLFPEDAHYVKGVGYDGERQIVYQKRTAEELQTLIDDAQSLIDEVGVVRADKINLTTDAYYCNALYTESNNGDKFTSYSVLNDDDHSTYLHTDYGSNAPGEDHYIRVDLGEDNQLTYFNLNYVTRKEGNVCAPTKVAIEASNDANAWMTLREVTSGLNDGNDQENMIEDLGDGTPYRYIRMRVYGTSTNQKANGHYYFIVSELGISAFDVELNQNYLSMSKDVVLAVYMALQSAQNENAYYELLDKYNALLAAREEVERLNVLKQPLVNLINQTNTLIEECGSVIYSENEVVTPISLKATETAGYAYLSCPFLYNPNNVTHNNSSDGDVDYNCEQLLDGNKTTYIHTNYKADGSTYPHYLQVAFGTSDIPAQFKFSYTTRSQGPNQVPKHVIVKGSNDGENFNAVLGEYTSSDATNPLPTTQETEWSVAAPLTGGYAYLRFYVTESPQNNPYFAMSEFSMEAYTPSGYSVTLGADAGEADEEMLIATYEAVQEAQSAVDFANTEAQVNEAIAKLQEQYQALSDAKAAVRYQSYYVQVVGTRDNGSNAFGVTYQGEKYHHGYIFDAPTTLTADQLKEINETASHQFVSIVVEDGVITVTYVPLYVVNVNGISDMGGVTFGGNLYGTGDEFPASSLDGLEAVEIDGYEVEMIVNEMYIEVSYYKNYTVIIEGVSANEPETVCVQYNSAEYVNDDVIRTLGEINENNLALVAPHYYAVEPINVNHDESTITVVFINKSDLNRLIEETTTLLYECKDYKYSFDEKDRAVVAVETAYSIYHESLVWANIYRYALNNLQSAMEALYEAMQTESSNRQVSREALNILIANANALLTRCEENSGDATQALIDEVSEVVTSAQTVADNMTSDVDALDAATNDLQAKYDVLSSAQQSTAKAELRSWIAQAEALIAECGTYANGLHEVRTPIVLQTGDAAAAYYLSTNAQESREGNIANLLTNGGFFHSSWSQSIGAAHYLQVDMGSQQSLQEFAFGYTTRDNGDGGPHPAVIVVSGSNSTEESFVELGTFDSGLPTTGKTSWETTTSIKASNPYRYLRFTVTKSEGTNGKQHGNGEYYFAMSEFALKSVSYETSYYVESVTSYGNVTEKQLLNVVIAMKEAEALANDSYNRAELETAAANLQAVYDILQAAHTDYSYLPVTLTTDMESPELYIMSSARGDNMLLQYVPAEGNMFGVVNATIVDDKVEANAKQLFYFTKGSAKGQVYVHPFAAGGKVLAASNKENGSAKVFVAEKSATEAMQWTFEQETIGDVVWYSLKGVDAPYFSNFGGRSNKMGFFGSKDDGSRLRFTDFDETAIEGSYAYHTLKVYFDEATKDVTSNNPGYYRGTKDWAAACDVASAVLADQNSTDADYLAAYNALFAENEGLEMILPVEGKFYVIRSAHDGYAKDALVYANLDDNKMRWGSKELTDATAIWTIVPAGNGAYHICNLHTGTYINGVDETLNETAGNITLESLSVNGQFGFHSSGMMHAQSGGAIVNYTTSANGASAWRIEEVGHAATIGQYLHTSLYLDYATTIPEGVKAYIAKNPSEEGTIDLVKLQGNVLPANTGVILYSENPGTYNFLYTNEATTDDVSENLLKGSASEQYVGDETGAKKYYIFGRSGDEVGLYRARMDYNADGENVGADKGTHFKASANKVYLELNATSAVALSGFRFRVGDDETGIKGITIDADATIYDLYGRRVLEVVTPGLYIINGEKRYINIK